MIVQLGLRNAIVQRGVVTFDDLLQHSGCRHAGEIGAARRHGQRQSKPQQIMHGVADHRLIQVADLNRDLAIGIGDRTQIAEVAIAADPDRRPCGFSTTLRAAQPLIEPGGAAAHVGLRRSRHLQVSTQQQDALPIIGMPGKAR